MQDDWTIYRTRFLVKARQLTEPLTIIDVFGHEHKGGAGDYLVESSDGSRRIAPRHIFEDVYVPLRGEEQHPPGMLARRARRESFTTTARTSVSRAN
jgi:hypothetical protein